MICANSFRKKIISFVKGVRLFGYGQEVLRQGAEHSLILLKNSFR